MCRHKGNLILHTIKPNPPSLTALKPICSQYRCGVSFRVFSDNKLKEFPFKENGHDRKGISMPIHFFQLLGCVWLGIWNSELCNRSSSVIHKAMTGWLFLNYQWQFSFSL